MGLKHGDIVHYDIKVNDAALKRLMENVLDDNTMTAIHALYAKTLDPWVPFLEGPLSQTVEIHPECIRYVQPYSHYQYVHPEFNHTTDYHPLATAYWDKVAMQTQLDSFMEQVREIIIRRAHEVYG